MNIAFAYDAIYPFVSGGGQRRYWEVGRRLVSRGHQVTLFGMQHWPGDRIIEREGVRLYGIGPPRPLFVKGRRSIPTALYIAKRHFIPLLRNQFDLIDIGEFPYFPAFSAKAVCLLKRRPLVMSWYESWGKYWFQYLGAAGIFGWLVERLAAFLPHVVVVETRYIQNQLVSWGVKRDRIVIIPSGVSYDWIQTIPKAEQQLDLIFVGRLIAAKGAETLVRTVAHLKTHGRSVRTAIVGDGPEKEKLQAEARKLRVDRDIEFYGWVEDDDQVIALMKAAKVFVYPSAPEGGWALSVLEANACGLPVVSVKSGILGENEVVLDGQSGLLAAREDPEMLAEKVDLLLSSEELRNNLAENARRFAKQHDWNNVARALEDVYVTLIKSA